MSNGIKISKNSILRFLMFFFLFQPAITYQLSKGLLSTIVSYVDEMVTVVALMYLLYCLANKRKTSPNNKKIIVYTILLNLIGVLSSFVNEGNKLFPVIIDAFTCNKFIIVFTATMFYAQKNDRMLTILFTMNRFIRAILCILGALTSLNFVFGFFPHHGYRMFIPTQKLFFEHPNDLAYVALICAVILVFNSQRYKNDFYLLIATFIVVSTMRMRHVAMMLIIWVVYFYFIKMRLRSKFVLGIAVAAVALLIGYDQFVNYYGNATETRGIVTAVSFTLANSHFPLGVGFAGYGSNMARQYYAPIYETLGFTRIWGLNFENDTFLTDQFWPAVIGQFGWIGMILFVLILVQIYKMIAPLLKKKIFAYISALLLFVYEILTSLGETAYYNPLAVVVFFIMAVCIIYGQKELVDVQVRKR